MELSVLTPQAKLPPTLTDVKVPNGGAGMGGMRHWSQQATVPSLLTPQAKLAPSLTEAKVPEGGAATSVHCSAPQQTTVPSALNAQAPIPPDALTDAKLPVGDGLGDT
jgi:hypothetical protein